MNLKQLAKELNLSISTVSKALDDSHEISEKTKSKVLEAASKHNYTPNPYASGLRKKRSNTIGVIIPEVADNFFSLAINGIQSIAENKGYHLLIYLSHDKYENERRIVEDCANGRVDGVLISISAETISAEHLLRLQKENVPLVFFDRALDDFEAAKVLTNDFESGYLSAKHLIENGCKRPMFLSFSECLTMCENRANGFFAALDDFKISSNEIVPIMYCSRKEEESYKQIQDLCNSNDRPDGIVASVEKLAMQLYLVCQDSAVSIPNDLKVVAFSTVEIAPILNPSLTTITQPAFEMGRVAAENLFKGIESKNFNLNQQVLIIPSQLIKRQSTSRYK
jgi:LacI family transcriptional regulator